MDINFELYKIFYYVADSLSFSKAASKLYISQSAVSQAIKTLESKLNIKLFFRNTKQVKLTNDGEILFRHIEQAYNLIKNGERIIDEINSLEKGEIRIGASDTICKYYLLNYFKEFHKLYPNVKIHVTNGTSPKCVELLKQGSVDFIISNIPNRYTDSSMKIKEIKPIQDVFIAGNQFKEIKIGNIFKGFRKISFSYARKTNIYKRIFDNMLLENNTDITPEIELGSTDLLVEMTKIGLGITFVWKKCIEEQLKSKEVFIVNIKEKIPERYLGIVTHKQIPLSIGAKKFIELLH